MFQGNNKERKKENIISTIERTNVGLNIDEKAIEVKVILDKGKLVNELNNSMIIEGEKKEEKNDNSIVEKLNESRTALGLKKKKKNSISYFSIYDEE